MRWLNTNSSIATIQVIFHTLKVANPRE
jgi:hypothetical protein